MATQLLFCWAVPPGFVQYSLPLLLCNCRQAFVSVYVVHPYSNTDTTAAWKKLRFILSVRPNFHMTNNLKIAVNAFASRVLMPFSSDETLFQW